MPTRAEHDERVEFVAELLVRQQKRMQIHRAVQAKWPVHWRSVDRYLVHAKEMLRKQAQMSKDDAKNIGVNVLIGVFREGKASERVAAVRVWSEIWGYNAPVKHEVSGADGQPLQPLVLCVTADDMPKPKQIAQPKAIDIHSESR